MNKRLKELRNTLGLSQEKFGEKLGVTKSAISKLEKNDRGISEQMIKSICREYNVEYAWLTKGLGEMFTDMNADIMARIDYIMTGENDIAKKTFKAFAKLDEEDWKVIEKLIDEITKK